MSKRSHCRSKHTEMSKRSHCRSKHTETQFINFTYIIYNRNENKNIANNDKIELFNMILKYHYPCCMNIYTQAQLSDDDKKGIIENEQLLFSKKIDEYNKMNNKKYDFYQIPRIIYDLFVILFTSNQKIDIQLKRFLFLENFKKYDYKSYCNEVDKYNSILPFWYFNDLIHGSIKSDIRIEPPFDYSQCMKIFEWIIGKYKNIKKESEIVMQDSIKKFIEFSQILIKNNTFIDEYLRKKGQQQNDFAIDFVQTNYKDLSTKHIYLLAYALLNINKSPLAFGSPEKKEYLINMLKNYNFLEQVYTGDAQITQHDNNNNIIKFLDKIDTGTNILLSTLQYEIGISTINKNNIFTLYRGSSDQKEGVIDEKNKNRGYSLSYNTSILNGLLYDSGACTYNYMLLTNNQLFSPNDKSFQNEKSEQYKTRYRIKKHFYGDNSNENNLLFIPPLHPLMQLASGGEFWHARSKIFKNSEIKNINVFAWYYDDYDNSYKFPDYLMSNYEKNEMNKKFKLFIAQNRKEVLDNKGKEDINLSLFGGDINENDTEYDDQIYYKKYLKYKQKYLMIKSQQKN